MLFAALQIGDANDDEWLGQVAGTLALPGVQGNGIVDDHGPEGAEGDKSRLEARSALVVACSPMLRRQPSRWTDRPLLCATIVYVVATLIYGLVASPTLWHRHTPYNHFALLAQSWLHLRLDLAGAPPLYASGNDFALFGDQWFVVFPGVPALLVLPWVAMAGSADKTLDGLFFLMLAGLGPAGMYLALERVRREAIAPLRQSSVVAFTTLYALGTVYFFTAVQGTVWFAAHVVAAAATTFFLYAAIGARYPLGAGIALGLAIGTRPVLGALAFFFVLEWWRVRPGWGNTAARRSLAWFGLPVAITLVALGWHNWARFGHVTEFGYRYLTVAWHGRIEKWGLFGYHYLARNLGLVLTSLPYLEHGRESWSLQINGHGLALWVTTPLYLWLLWPRHQSVLHRALYTALALVALPSLLYQNSGWLQFGQRFSNDYAPLLIVLLAVGGYRWSPPMKVAWVWAVAINLFGAVTFGRPEYAKYYYIERSQRVIYQLD